MKSLFIFLIGFPLLFLASCGSNNEEDAFSSLQGDWRLSKVIESSSQLQNNMVIDNSSQEWNGVLGTFVFSDKLMDYSIELDFPKTLSQNYAFERTKENSGFTQVNVYTIKGDQIDFRVRFGDETSDAHKDANMIVLQSKEVTADSVEKETRYTLIK